jgi:hypothetical protein
MNKGQAAAGQTAAAFLFFSQKLGMEELNVKEKAKKNRMPLSSKDRSMV